MQFILKKIVQLLFIHSFFFAGWASVLLMVLKNKNIFSLTVYNMILTRDVVVPTQIFSSGFCTNVLY